MTKKDKLPTALSSQDRGFMAFPHEILLPFLRNAIITIKENVCSGMYIKYGSKLLEVRQNNSTQILRIFWSLIHAFNMYLGVFEHHHYLYNI